MKDENENYFTRLNAVNVKDKIEKKGNKLSYLSWAWAWGEMKKRHPDATYTVYENNDGWPYFTDGRTGWVKTSVTINGLEHIEYLPIMDNTNRSIPADKVTSFDVNKAVQRSVTKACARHGLGLYIYTGEDLPGDDTDKTPKKTTSSPINLYAKLLEDKDIYDDRLVNRFAALTQDEQRAEYKRIKDLPADAVVHVQ